MTEYSDKYISDKYISDRYFYAEYFNWAYHLGEEDGIKSGIKDTIYKNPCKPYCNSVAKEVIYKLQFLNSGSGDEEIMENIEYGYQKGFAKMYKEIYNRHKKIFRELKNVLNISLLEKNIFEKKFRNMYDTNIILKIKSFLN